MEAVRFCGQGASETWARTRSSGINWTAKQPVKLDKGVAKCGQAGTAQVCGGKTELLLDVPPLMSGRALGTEAKTVPRATVRI